MNPPLTFDAITLNDFGGIGLEFYTTVAKPYFEGHCMRHDWQLASLQWHTTT